MIYLYRMFSLHLICLVKSSKRLPSELSPQNLMGPKITPDNTLGRILTPHNEQNQVDSKYFSLCACLLVSPESNASGG